MFCSEACMELAKKTFHRSESKILSESFSPLSMRIYMNALALFDGSIEDLRDFLCTNQSPPRTIFDCDFSHSDEIENDKNGLLAIFALIDDVDFTDKNIDQFVTYFLECTLEILKKYLKLSFKETFHALYLFDSLLNCSNKSNSVALEFDNKRLHLVIKPISKGEQLFTSYR